MEETDEGWVNVEDAAKGDSIRIKAGRKCGRTFMQQTTGHKGIPLDEPIHAITTQIGKWLMVIDSGDDDYGIERCGFQMTTF